MLNNVLKKVQNTLNAGLNNVKMIVNTLNESRPLISINEKEYYLDNLIAEGGYAHIYKIQSVSDDKFYALKKINIQSSNHKKQVKREIKIWKELSKYSNIVELISFSITEKNVYIVMEYCEEGTLLDFVNNHEGNISEVEALMIFNQILLGVNAMHSQKPPIAHRDLKIENILKVKRNYKICDFGSASNEIFDPKISDDFVKEENYSNFEKHSTLYYRAPEMCNRYSQFVVSEKVDIWSLGCVLYTMVFKEQPFINAQKLEIINGNYNFPKDEQKLYSEKFLDLIRVLLTPNPDNRPNVLQVMEWTNYWNDVDKIPLSPEVEEIKKRQIKSGGSFNKSHKKKLLSAEEISKIQKRLKNKEKKENDENLEYDVMKGKKEKKQKNYDDINQIFGFTSSNNENENNNEKKEENKKSNFDDDLFNVFSAPSQNNNNINIKKEENKNENKDLLDMEFYEVDETKQKDNKTSADNNKNNDLDDIFANFANNNNINNEKKEENQNTNKNNNNNFDLLFSNEKENKKEIKKETSTMKKTDLNDLLNAINNENKKDKSNNNDLLDMNNNSNKKSEITFKMNGQDIFSNFEPSEPEKKEESQKSKVNEDLFAAFNNPQKTANENIKNDGNISKLEDDLFAAFAQPQTKTKEEEKEIKKERKEINKPNLKKIFFQHLVLHKIKQMKKKKIIVKRKKKKLKCQI